MRSHEWSALTRTEIGALAREGALAVLPIGATEQHGDHLPVGTDARIVGHVALAAARLCEAKVVVLPTVSAAFSPHHSSWPGTLSLSLSTLSAVIADMTASVAAAGFTRQLIVNGHGGNRGPLISITAELVSAGRMLGYVDYWGPPATEIAATLRGARKLVGHACEMETSMMMALDRHHQEARDFYTTAAKDLAPRLDYPSIGNGGSVEEDGGWWPPVFGPDDCGYHGEPALATPETGDALLAAIVPRLADFYTRFSRLDLRAGSAIFQERTR
jgi:creatinine amidohydrolase